MQRCSLIVFALLVATPLFATPLFSAQTAVLANSQPKSCQVEPTKYEGGQAVQVSNHWV
ncbi:MAG: hypothetical protein WA824_09385 [Candidatus Sulfotelmatobacter sp.]